MGLYKYYPIPSDRMGALWTLLSIQDACILEFGTAGTTRFAINTFNKMQANENSKLFSTHMDEMDIVMGRTKRLEKAIDTIALHHKPAVLFVMPSTISSIIGTDIPSLCADYQEKYPEMKIVAVSSDGFQGNYPIGITKTLKLLVESLSEPIVKSETLTYNIIGCCADDYNYASDLNEIKRLMRDCFNAQPNCILSSNTSINEIKSIGAAHINLVLRKEGLATAQWLQDKYDIPYVYQKPYGLNSTLDWLDALSQKFELPYNKTYIEEDIALLQTAINTTKGYLQRTGQTSMCLGGPFDTVKGISKFAAELGYTLTSLWCDAPENAQENISFYEEKQWIAAVSNPNINVCMGSAIALELAPNTCKKLQIAHPNKNYTLLHYPYTPYVGLRGALYLLSQWTNS